MSYESSARPSRHIDMLEGKAPTLAANFVTRLESDDVEGKRKREKPIKPTTVVNPKQQWRDNLPDWLRHAEPLESRYYHFKWWLFARTRYRKPLHNGSEDTGSVPVFEDYTREYWRSSDYVRASRQYSESTIAVINASGGMGKTTVVSLLAANRKRATDMSVIAYDGDTSDPNLMKWFDLDPTRAFTGADLDRKVSSGYIPTYSDLVRWLSVDPESGVQVVHAERGRSLSGNQTIQNIRHLKPSAHTLIGDTQPGTFEGEQATPAIIESANIVVVAARSSDAKGRDAVSATLDYEPYNLIEDDGRVAKHVLIVMTDVDPRDYNLRTRYQFAERYNAAVDQVMLIPTSSYIRGSRSTNKNDKVNKIRIFSLDPRTRHAVGKLDQRVSELAIQLNTQVSTPRDADKST